MPGIVISARDRKISFQSLKTSQSVPKDRYVSKLELPSDKWLCEASFPLTKFFLFLFIPYEMISRISPDGSFFISSLSQTPSVYLKSIKFIHSFIPQIFIEHLLCTRYGTWPWKSSCKLNKKGLTERKIK